MTTVIGMAGRDPETLEAYVLICADSRGTFKRVNMASSNEDRKLLTGKDANYVIGYAGTNLSNHFSEDCDSELYNFINNPKMESIPSLEDKLKKMNDKLLISEKEKNAYIVSLSMSDYEPELYVFGKSQLFPMDKYAVIGSGEEHAKSALKDLKLSTIEGRVNISKVEAISAAFEAMNYAANKDRWTGGHMDVALITQSGITFLPAHKILSKSLNADCPLLDEHDNPYILGIHPRQYEWE